MLTNKGAFLSLIINLLCHVYGRLCCQVIMTKTLTGYDVLVCQGVITNTSIHIYISIFALKMSQLSE